MPNHVATRLTLKGDVGQINKFIAAADSGQDGKHLEFERLFPCDPRLEITCGSQTDDGIFALTGKTGPGMFKCSPLEYPHYKQMGILTVEDFKKHLEETSPESLVMGQKALDNIKDFGHPTWYEWKIANWGTKWGCYDTSEWNNGVITYNTAWSPATKFFLNVSKDYPNVSFKHEFADEGGSFLGAETIENGEIVSELELDWDGTEGKALREELGYGDCEEEEVQA